MTDPTLPLLVCIAGLLLLLAGAEALAAARLRPGIGLAATLAAGMGALLVLLWLVMGGSAEVLHLPVGPPGLALRLVLDPLGGFALLLVLLAGTAVLGFGAERRPGRHAPSRTGPGAVLATALLALLSASPATVLLTLGAGAVALLSGAGGHRHARPAALFAGSGLLTAVGSGVLAAPGPMPASHMLLLLACALAGPGALLGLFPFARVHGATLTVPCPERRAMLAACTAAIGLAWLLRLLSAAQPETASPWWAAAPLVLGSLTLVQAAAHALGGTRMEVAAAALTRGLGGMVTVATGLVLIARAADLPDMARLALAAACLAATAACLGGTLLHMAGWGVGMAAGTTRLLATGGIAHRAPALFGAALAALLTLLALPPGLGFAALWHLLQAILAAPRLPSGLSWLLACVIAAIATGTALGMVAAARVIGVVFLGRPRTPRASAAEPPAAAACVPLTALAVLTLLLGLLPNLVPGLLAASAIRDLSGAAGSGVLTLTTADGAGASPPALLFLLIGVLALAVAMPAGRREDPPRPIPAWSGGAGPLPPWLPYGAPNTQTDGSGFLLARLPARRLRPWRPRPIPAAAWSGWLLAGGLLILIVILLARGGA